VEKVMADMEKVKKGLECCMKSTEDNPFAECEHCPYNEISIAVQECRAVLSADALALLKEQEDIISNYKEVVENLLQQLQDIEKYMTPYGMVKDVKAYVELLKEQENTIIELQNAYNYLQTQFFEAQDKLLKEQEAVKPTIDEYGNKRCGSCGRKLQSISDPDLFCCKCGKPVL
jgi:hypothetical protein